MKITKSELRIITNDEQLCVVKDAFEPIEIGEKYTFFYLPRTKWVMDVIDENDVSLMKKQRQGAGDKYQ